MNKVSKPVGRSLSNITIAAALLLPVIGLGGSWAKTHSDSLKGVEWDIPIRGYDPRDLLRGHYIQYQYDWPGMSGDRRSTWDSDDLCIKGSTPKITEVSEIEDDGLGEAKCVSIVRANRLDIYGWMSTERGRMYIPQTQGAPLEANFRNPKLRGIIRARIRDDGVIMPLSIRFVPNLTGDPVQNDGRLQVTNISEEFPDAPPPAQKATQ